MKKLSVALAGATILSVGYIAHAQSPVVNAAETTNSSTQKTTEVQEFSPWDQQSGDQIRFAVGGGNLPDEIYSFVKGFLHLYKVVYIGNATYMGYYH